MCFARLRGFQAERGEKERSCHFPDFGIIPSHFFVFERTKTPFWILFDIQQTKKAICTIDIYGVKQYNNGEKQEDAK